MSNIKDSLSLKLLKIVLLAALCLGIIFSAAQILLDAYNTRRTITNDATHILNMFRDPSSQAAYSLNKEMALEVVEGLLQHDSVHSATIDHPSEPVLAEKSRPLSHQPTRWLTDLFLGKEQSFNIRLVGSHPYKEYYGDLIITLDTANYGKNFIISSIIIFISGILRSLIMAIVLYLVYRWLLTKPLTKIIDFLSNINPDNPSAYKIPLLKGNEHNELGKWINTTNQLLESIERNTYLRHTAESSLQQISRHDVLTGLLNRHYFQSKLEKILTFAKQRNNRVAIFCIGIDNFKAINEQFGYEIGDQLLLALADRLRAHNGYTSVLARLGGDQFALVENNIKQVYEVAQLAQNVLDSVHAPFQLPGGHELINLSASIGITLFPEDDENTEKLLQKSEQTMQLTKNCVGGEYRFYVAQIDHEIRLLRRLEKDLRIALECNEQLYIVYQPQISYKSREIVGVEALLRWKHPVLGELKPDQFIPVAEKSGLILRLTEWVLTYACQQLDIWHKAGFNLRLAVNLSSVQLSGSNLSNYIAQLINKYQLPKNSLELEITESCLMQEMQTVACCLKQIQQAGALIAIDDFGTGYSSLSYLKNLPVDKIKIDRSFINGLLDNDENITIVKTIIQLSHGLKLKVIAEGIETKDQEDFLIRNSCDEGQGFYYSKPLKVNQLDIRLKQDQELLPV